MSRIPENFINDLVNRVDIVEVIDARVPLKKTGREYQACCPFHSEKSPSFTVSPQKQFYHCFGCGAHGTAIGFLMAYDRLEFPDAVRTLAESVGMEVPVEGGGKDEQKDTALYDAMEAASGYFRRALKDNDRAVQYLRQRGLTGEIAAAFAIGYAPDSWDGLGNHLRERGIRNEQIVASGMGIRGKQETPYDRFRDRIMFPIRDRRGRVIAFGGRVLDKGEPKYLNSPETPLFHKGRELYGLWEAKQAYQNLPRLLFVEGYMDVVALAQNDIRYAVATLGTATTPEHMDIAFRSTREVVFCFDGDKAGRRAGWRALENSLGAIRDGRQLKFLFLPEGEDPDTLVRKEGKDAFERRIAAAQPLSDFLLEQLAAQSDLDTIEGRARIVDLARPYLEKIPDAIYRSLLEDKLSQLSRMDADRLGHLIGSPKPSAAPRHRGEPVMTPIRRSLVLLLNHPPLARLALDHRTELAKLELKGSEVLLELLDLLSDRPDIRLAGILEAWRDHPLGPALARLAEVDMDMSEEGMTAEFEHVLKYQLLGRIAERERESRLKALRDRKPSELSEAEKAELRALLSAGNT